MKRHYDLTHYFITPHKELPVSYVKSCMKFMAAGSIAARIYKYYSKKEWRKIRKDFEDNGYPWLKRKK